MLVLAFWYIWQNSIRILQNSVKSNSFSLEKSFTHWKWGLKIRNLVIFLAEFDILREFCQNAELGDNTLFNNTVFPFFSRYFRKLTRIGRLSWFLRIELNENSIRILPEFYGNIDTKWINILLKTIFCDNQIIQKYYRSWLLSNIEA